MTAAAEKFLARFRKVLEYIDTHLDERLDVERLSSVTAFSKFHFHRQFTELFGMGVYKYVQLSRLKRASFRLAFRERSPVMDIALASGYEGPEAFARAFKKTVGQSPSEFRKQPQWISWYATYRQLSALRSKYMTADIRAEQVRIVEFQETKVATFEHRGDPRLMGESVRKFIGWRRQNGLSPPASATFNIVYRHPVDADDGDCHYDLCAATDRDVPANSQGVVAKVIPGGRCATLRHVGSDDTLGEAVSYLYSQWLPQSGEEPRDFPLYFQRSKFFPDMPENEAVTDIYLPLK